MDGDVLGDLPDDEPWSSYGQSQRPPPQILCADVDADDDGSDFGASTLVMLPSCSNRPCMRRQLTSRGHENHCSVAVRLATPPILVGTRTSSEVSSMASSV